MRKFFLMTAFVIGIFVAQMSQAEAAEVFCFTETRGGKTTYTYVLTDSMQGTDYGFKVRLHTVDGNNSYSKY